MGHMDEIRTAGANAVRKIYSLAHELMGVMLTVEPQRVHHECIYALQIEALAFRDRLHIRDVRQLSETIAHHRQVVVHHLEAQHGNITNVQLHMEGQHMEFQSGHAGIEMICETIRHVVVQSVHSGAIAVNINVAKPAIGSQVVDASHMVVMYMCEEHAVYLSVWLAENLLAEVGPTVDEQTRGGCLQQCRCACAMVTRVSASAHLALASYHGHATRGACTKKRQLHLMFTSG